LIGAANSGVALRGGFHAVGTVWQRDCADNARAKTVIASPAAIGVAIGNVSSVVRLETLTVLTRSVGTSIAAAAGGSCYGIMVSGTGSLASLDDVRVSAGKGGAGGPVTSMVNPPVPTCGGVDDCASGANGGVGPNGQQPSQGTYIALGYVPANGNAGVVGTRGSNGTAGGAANQASCHLGAGCSGGGALCTSLFCGDLTPIGLVSSSPGKCGCGGAGGPAGTGGRGGGASIALFVSGAGTAVSVTRSSLNAQDGGAGSAGLQGGDGSSGSPGTVGATATCWGDCRAVNHGGLNCNCEQPGTSIISGGTAGGVGGTGGPGGSGSGGSGGPSIGVLRLNGALVTLDGASTIGIGNAGAGAQGAPAGIAQPTHVR
jgi:hypothetical protein